jgi:hypothetical protein
MVERTPPNVLPNKEDETFVSASTFDEVRPLLAPPVKQATPIHINAMRQYREYRIAQLSATTAAARKTAGSTTRGALISATDEIYKLIPDEHRS